MRTVIKEYSEIIIALDISKSMLAEDSKPSMLEKAKMIVSEIVEENPGKKMGIIVFSGTAMWQCPLTFDLHALKMFLQSVETTNLPLGGTCISSAVLLASKVASCESAGSRAMILISDGENHNSKIKEAVNAAKKAGLRIISIGIGKKEGAPIPVKDETGTVVDYVKDINGKVVISRVNPVLLKSFAEETGGKYFDALDDDVYPSLVKAVRNLDKNNSEVGMKSSKTDRFQIFLLLGLIALFAELLFPLRRKR